MSITNKKHHRKKSEAEARLEAVKWSSSFFLENDPSKFPAAFEVIRHLFDKDENGNTNIYADKAARNFLKNFVNYLPEPCEKITRTALNKANQPEMNVIACRLILENKIEFYHFLEETFTQDSKSIFNKFARLFDYERKKLICI